jgi:plastocyanin
MLFAAASIALISAHLAAAADHQITVGGPGGALTFTPQAIFAAPGDSVYFTFQPKNHSVVQGSFAAPCSPLQDSYSQPLFDSGFHPVAAGSTSYDVVKYDVKDSAPVWMHCGQVGHCGKGMVFAINCGPDGAPNSFTNFRDSALAIGAAASSAAPAPSGTTAVYGSITVKPDPAQPTVTATVTLESSTWTTVYASYPNSPGPTPDSIAGTTHTVTVGASGLTYSPPSIQAKPRDKIRFVFASKNHTITQSSFSNPCRKLELTSPTGQIGFDSGFQPVPAGTPESAFPVYEVLVNDTNPIYAYCRQGNHCGSGMVFAVNLDETSDRNYAAFVSLAKNINGTAQQSNGNGSTTPNTASHLAATGIVGFLGAIIALFL